MNKKKLLAIALAVCLIAILSFTTLAWFTDSDEATNTFTVGSVEIVQHEQQYGEDGNLEDFVDDDQLLLPIVNKDEPNKDPNYQDKIVTVENTGKNPAYVRTWIAVPEDLVEFLHLDYSDSTKWSAPVKHTSLLSYGSINYVVYCSTWMEPLAVYTTTDPVLEGVYLDAAVDLNVYRDASGNVTHAYFVWENNEVTGVNAAQPIQVLVWTQAVQSEGFSDAQTALESAFGSDISGFTGN